MIDTIAVIMRLVKSSMRGTVSVSITSMYAPTGVGWAVNAMLENVMRPLTARARLRPTMKGPTNGSTSSIDTIVALGSGSKKSINTGAMTLPLFTATGFCTMTNDEGVVAFVSNPQESAY